MTSNPDEGPGRSRLRWLAGAAVVLAVPLAVVWWPGCRQYPPVTSREALSVMRALYTACNTKDPARLAKVEQAADRLTRDGKLSAAEQEAFARVVGLARAGDWERAEEAALRFAEDQVGQGDPDPDRHADHDHQKDPPKRKPKG